MIKQMAAVIFTVRDLDEACEFYTQALGLKLAYRSKKTGWAEFDLGGARLALQQREPYGGGRNPLLSLHVMNLRSTVATLKNRGVRFEDDGLLHDDFFGTWTNCLDGDNNLINLFEPKAT
ncbi:MAG: VOC family protein [Gammaproteobacteria bacterium]|nr:VOC family protein [Gammaproteobacteria bacterium]